MNPRRPCALCGYEIGTDLPTEGTSAARKEKLAVFDFDGTCITGNSPVRLCSYMLRRRMLDPTVVVRLLGWGFFYKCHLPQNESWVRGLVFKAFDGEPVEKVNRFIVRFYDETIIHLWRPDALRTMQCLHDAGYKVLLVSATFEPIAMRAMEHAPIDAQISTRMKVVDGCYTREVEGEPVEGAEKMNALVRLADAEYGAGNWELVYSFGDHYSDLPLLEAAQRPNAVTPDTTLDRYARKHGWPVRRWLSIEEEREEEAGSSPRRASRRHTGK